MDRDSPAVRTPRSRTEPSHPEHRRPDQPWADCYDDDVPATVSVPDRPFAVLLDEAADLWPGATALCHLGRDISYRELRHEVEQLSTVLARLGVVGGDRVALVLPNCPQFVIGTHAILRLGAVAVPLDPTWTAEQVTAALTDSGAEVVFCLDRLLAPVTSARDDPATVVREVVVTVATDYLPALNRLALSVPTRSARKERTRVSGSVPSGAGVRLWSEELRRTRGAPVPAAGKPDGLEPDRDAAVLLYSAGPDGLPAAVFTGTNLRAAGEQAAAWLTHARPGREAVLVGLPLWTAEGLALCLSAAAVLGAGLLLVPRDVSEAVLPALSAMRPSVAIGPAKFLDGLLEAEAPVVDLRSLRLCVTGPDLVDADVVARWERSSGARVVAGVSAPGAPVLLGTPMRSDSTVPVPRGVERVALPLPSTEVRIVDRTGRVLPPGAPGLLQARGPQVFAGFWNRPDLTARYLAGGWLATGVPACLHADGWVEVLDSTG